MYIGLSNSALYDAFTLFLSVFLSHLPFPFSVKDDRFAAEVNV